MRFYVASKFERKADVQRTIDALRRLGHTIIGDWTTHDAEREVGAARERMLTAFAKEDRYAVEHCDVFLLLHDERCRGGFTELGIALANRRRIIVIGGASSFPEKGPIFYADPAVEHYDNTAMFLASIGPVDGEENS